MNPQHSEIGIIYQCVKSELNNQISPFLVLTISLPDESGLVSVLLIRSIANSNKGKGTIKLYPDEIEGHTFEKMLTINLSEQTYVSSESLHKKQGQLKYEKLKEVLKKCFMRQTETYYNAIHKPIQQQSFSPGVTRIPYSGRVFDQQEMKNLIDSSLDFWLTSGPYTEKFERAFAKYIGVRYCSLVNSGSSANLIALSALTSQKLGDKRIQKGDEVITVAAGFPTTINPILQLGAIPVFVDITLPTYNIDVSMLEEARSSRSKAVMIAHTLGNPFQIDEVRSFCNKYDLWLIEDNCDALGSTYHNKLTGSFGDIATSSFYPPHHITLGEGGAVYTNNSLLKVIIESFRDWGRDCYCPSGKDNTCKKRFSWELGNLPKGYDHKYIYSHLGYNMKATEMQASIGCEQLNKIQSFTDQRRKNWDILYNGIKELDDIFILPEATPNSNPSWFGFLLAIREPSTISRKDILQHLESRNIQSRMLFSGNYINQPVFDNYRNDKTSYRVVGDMENSNSIMNNCFWVGVYPGLNRIKIEYIVEQIHQSCQYIKTNPY